MRDGSELSAEEKDWARGVGVHDVDRIRIAYQRVVPMPFSSLARVVSYFKKCPISPIGLAAHYGIYLAEDCRSDPSLLVHELTHVAQYERLGGIRGFLAQYLDQWLRDGYWESQMETEARAAAVPYNRPPGS